MSAGGTGPAPSANANANGRPSPEAARRTLPRRNSRAKVPSAVVPPPPPPFPRLTSRNSSQAVPKVAQGGDEPQVPVSPAYAVGTGMTRSASGAQYPASGAGSGAAGGGDGQQQEYVAATGAASQAEQVAQQERSDGGNPFAQILGRISIDDSARQ